MLYFVNYDVTAYKSAWQKLPQASFRTWRNKKFMNKKITIRPEEHKDYKSIISLILRSFQETYKGSLSGIKGYIVYDMYFNA